MDECPCLIPDENDNCVDCGKHIEISDVGEPPDLGDIPGIVRLIETTVKSYAELVKDNVDPKHPTLPRLRLIGGRFIRIPHKDLYKSLLGPSFVSAKALGYRGTLERWTEIIWEATPPTASRQACP